jgi:hypothetical protein
MQNLGDTRVTLNAPDVNLRGRRGSMKTTTKSIEQLLLTKDSPLPLEVMPNKMGINLCSVSALTWTKQDDGQLINLIIHFKPNIELAEDSDEMYSPEAIAQFPAKTLDDKIDEIAAQAEFVPEKTELPKGVICTSCGKITNQDGLAKIISKIPTTIEEVEQAEKIIRNSLPESLQDPKRLLREFDLHKQVEELDKKNIEFLNISVRTYNELISAKQEIQRLKNQISESNIKPHVTGVGKYNTKRTPPRPPPKKG